MDLIYIDILRQVYPQDLSCQFDIDFHVLGGFDAMKIQRGDSIEKLKQFHEIGHNTVPSMFDRQPLFLCAPDFQETNDIFSRDGVFFSCPLVLTLFQLNKKLLAKSPLELNKPTDLIKAFVELVHQSMLDILDKSDIIPFQVFWNLGASDIVVAFRPLSLGKLVPILQKLRTAHSQNILVESSCSHLAFPNAVDNLHSTRERQINDWLKQEPQNIQMLTLVNTCLGYNQLNSSAYFLFGEWDYAYQHPIQTYGDFLTSKILKPFHEAGLKDFRTSYAIPMIPCAPEDPTRSDSVSSISEDWISAVQTVVNRFANVVKVSETIYGSEHCFTVFDTIHSFGNTIAGLGKFLLRLKQGRFEEDLYLYIQPIFVALTKITEEYIYFLDQLYSQQRYRQCVNIIQEYVDDTSILIERLQHLFTIMAVSPHTFMETYSSNMRSLSAASKLIGAYQGVIAFLEDAFPDQIEGKNANHQILILPYRKIQPAHTLLYRSSSPTNRISYIQIDFTRMFSLQSTTFMLLHECAHHLGNRFREERFSFFCQSAVCLTLERELGFGHFLYQPLRSFLQILDPSVPNEDCSVDEEQTDLDFWSQSSLLYGLSDEDKKVLGCDVAVKIRNATRELLQKCGSFYADDIREYYEDFQRANEQETDRIKLRNHYSHQTVQSVKDYINRYITFKKVASYTTENGKQILHDNVSPFFDTCEKVAEQVYNFIAEKQGNLWDAGRFKALHSAPFSIEYLLCYLSEDLPSLGHLRAIFSDIYADLFAILLLDLNYHDYLSMIADFMGAEFNKGLLSPNTLARILVVSHVRYPNENLTTFLKQVKPAYHLEQEIKYYWKRIANSSYVYGFHEYAAYCHTHLTDMINHTHGFKEGIQILRDLVAVNTQESLNAVYFFHKYLIGRQNAL